MDTFLITVLLWATALGSGLMAGIYFAFSAFIMQSLADIEAASGIAAMNAINRVIVKSWFMPLFFVSSLVAALLIVIGIVYIGEAGAVLTILAGACYFVGMFVSTAAFNVPLNNALAAVEPTSAGGQDIWARYLKVWTRWNTSRTICSLVSCILCIWVLSV